MAISDSAPLLGKQQTPPWDTQLPASEHEDWPRHQRLLLLHRGPAAGDAQRSCLPAIPREATAPRLRPRPREHRVPGRCSNQQHAPLAIPAQYQSREVGLQSPAEAACRWRRARPAVGVVLPPLLGAWKQTDRSQLAAESAAAGSEGDRQ